MSIDEKKNQSESEDHAVNVVNTIMFNRRVRFVLHPLLIAGVADIAETRPTDSDHDGSGKTPKRTEVGSVRNGRPHGQSRIGAAVDYPTGGSPKTTTIVAVTGQRSAPRSSSCCLHGGGPCDNYPELRGGAESDNSNRQTGAGRRAGAPTRRGTRPPPPSRIPVPRPRGPEPPRRQDRPVELYVGSRLPVPVRPGRARARRIPRNDRHGARCAFGAAPPADSVCSWPVNVRLVCVLLCRPNGTDDRFDCDDDTAALRSVVVDLPTIKVPLSRYVNPPPNRGRGWGDSVGGAECWQTNNCSMAAQTRFVDDDGGDCGDKVIEERTDDDDEDESTANGDRTLRDVVVVSTGDGVARLAPRLREVGGPDDGLPQAECDGHLASVGGEKSDPKKNPLAKLCDPCLDTFGQHLPKKRPGSMDVAYRELLGDCAPPVFTDAERKTVAPVLLRVLESVDDDTNDCPTDNPDTTTIVAVAGQRSASQSSSSSSSCRLPGGGGGHCDYYYERCSAGSDNHNAAPRQTGAGRRAGAPIRGTRPPPPSRIPVPRPRVPEPPRRQDRPVVLYVGSRLPVPDRPGRAPARRIPRNDRHGVRCSDVRPRACGDQNDRRRWCTVAAEAEPQPSGAVDVRSDCDDDTVALRSAVAVDGPADLTARHRWSSADLRPAPIALDAPECGPLDRNTL